MAPKTSELAKVRKELIVRYLSKFGLLDNLTYVIRPQRECQDVTLRHVSKYFGADRMYRATSPYAGKPCS